MSDAAQARYFAGLKKHRQKDYEGAIAALQEAVQLDPDLADAWEALGVLFDKCDRLDEAIAATEKLAEIQPDAIMAHTNLSRFYMKKGWTEKAEDEQGKARLLGWKQDLADQGASGSEGLTQATPQGETTPQLATLVTTPQQPAAPSGPDPALLERKIQQFEKLAETNPDDVMSRFTLGKLYVQADRSADAIKIMEALLESKPDYTAAFPILGEAYEKAGKLARAIKTYKAGIELAERKGDLHPRNQMQERLAALTG